MIRVLYVGDSGVMIGPFFIASPFLMELKALDVKNFGQPLIDALSADPDVDLTYMQTWTAHKSFPKTAEELSQYHVILLSDVEAETLFFYPEFYTPSEWTKTVTFPNRLASIRTFVERGGGLGMIGGWASFSGRYGHAGWKNTPVEEALPVEMLDGDDRVETPEGSAVKVKNGGHPIMKSLAWDEVTHILGYNRVKLKPGGRLLATVGRANHPFIVVGKHGKGRNFAFMSDPAPHWGINFMKWEHYHMFWTNVVKWLGHSE